MRIRCFSCGRSVSNEINQDVVLRAAAKCPICSEKEYNKLLSYEETLMFYADPHTYFAISFIPDPPTGDFITDFSEVGSLGLKPGKRAREVLGLEPEEEDRIEGG